MANLVAVTGAAGALGRAVVAEFGMRATSVVALDRPGSGVADIAAHGEPAVHPIEADLSDPEAVARAWRDVDRIGVPSALVALAGGFVDGGLAEVTATDLDMLWRANFATALWSCQQAASRLAVTGGAIVTVGSRTAVSGAAPVAHATSKAAVVRLTEVLADELRPSRIRVNAVLPSVIDTPANREWMSTEQAGRAVPPAAIAKVVAFLCSPEASVVSGAVIPVYGDA